MKINFIRLHREAIAPSRAKKGDACFDLTAVSATSYPGFIEYSTGIAMDIPAGYVGLLFPRSSVTNKNLMLKNCVGVIDSGYRGDITFRFLELIPNQFDIEDFGGIHVKQFKKYAPGDRIGQIMIMKLPDVEFCEVETLSESERGKGGYGSTGD